MIIIIFVTFINGQDIPLSSKDLIDASGSIFSNITVIRYLYIKKFKTVVFRKRLKKKQEKEKRRLRDHFDID